MYGGELKSAIPVPSRRNSGHIATATSGPESCKAACSLAATSSTVPGGTVLRITTAWNARAGIESLSALYEVLHNPVYVGEVGSAARGGRSANAQE